MKIGDSRKTHRNPHCTVKDHQHDAERCLQSKATRIIPLSAILKSWIPVVAVVLILVVISMLNKSQKSSKALAPAVLNDSGFYSILPEEDIECFAESGDFLYAGGKSGLFILNKKTFAPVHQLNFSGKLSYVKSICSDTDGTLWVGSIHGVLQYNPVLKTETWWTTKNGLPDNRVNTIVLDSSNHIWAGTWGGAAWLDDTGWHIMNKKNGISSDMVNTICEDGMGGLWFGAYNVPDGVISILSDFKRFTEYNGTKASDADKSIRSMLPSDWQYLTVNDGIPHSCITAILQTSPGTIWIGTGFLEAGGACKAVLTNEKWLVQSVLHKSVNNADLQVDDRVITQSGGLIGEKVRSLFLDSKRRLWLGSEYDGGTILIDPTIINGSSTPAVIGQPVTGVSLPNNTTMSWLTTDNGLCNAEIKKTHEDDNGTFWLATRSGITVIPKVLQ